MHITRVSSGCANRKHSPCRPVLGDFGTVQFPSPHAATAGVTASPLINKVDTSYWTGALVKGLALVMGFTPRVGAIPLIYAATAPELTGMLLSPFPRSCQLLFFGVGPVLHRCSFACGATVSTSYMWGMLTRGSGCANCQDSLLWGTQHIFQPQLEADLSETMGYEAAPQQHMQTLARSPLVIPQPFLSLACSLILSSRTEQRLRRTIVWIASPHLELRLDVPLSDVPLSLRKCSPVKPCQTSQPMSASLP